METLVDFRIRCLLVCLGIEIEIHNNIMQVSSDWEKSTLSYRICKTKCRTKSLSIDIYVKETL